MPMLKCRNADTKEIIGLDKSFYDNDDDNFFLLIAFQSITILITIVSRFICRSTTRCTSIVCATFLAIELLLENSQRIFLNLYGGIQYGTIAYYMTQFFVLLTLVVEISKSKSAVKIQSTIEIARATFLGVKYRRRFPMTFLTYSTTYRTTYRYF